MAATMYGCGLVVTVDSDEPEMPVVIWTRCGRWSATLDHATDHGELLGSGYFDDAMHLTIAQKQWIADLLPTIEEMLYDGPVGPAYA